jgi:transposase
LNPKRRDAAVRLRGLRTGEGEGVPPLSLAELARELAQLAVVRAQIPQIEAERGQRLNEAPDTSAHRMTAMLAKLHGVAVETAELLASEDFRRRLRHRRPAARYAGADQGARRERFAAPRKGAGPGRQCAGPPPHDRAGLALPQIPAAERAGAMVPRAHR